jgi:hypothetical protein
MLGGYQLLGILIKKLYIKKIQMWNLVGPSLEVFLANLNLSSLDMCTFYLCKRACIMGMEKGDAHWT